MLRLKPEIKQQKRFRRKAKPFLFASVGQKEKNLAKKCGRGIVTADKQKTN